ncbi:MAG: ATP synthase subunit b [Parcubacteria group bacterium GW2011_GWB1_56_8]|nr:MAG: ATP synthase subunit b [Parcubacteria group bacterium GW2011_GWB1_56_8]
MEQLGIEPNLLLAQIVNFLIILFVLSKLLYTPILRMLEKRKKEIAEGLRLTEKMREEEVAMEERKTRLLNEARKEARNIIEEGKKEGEGAKKEIIAAAEVEAQEILKKGKSDVSDLRRRMEKDVRKAAVSIATAMTTRLVSSAMSANDQHKVLAKHIKELESIKT